MNRDSRCARMEKDSQRGTTLIVVLILLLLASLLALFAMNVGVFAQRTSAADMRARVVHETLEAALAQGTEWIKNNQTKTDLTNATSAALWTRCTATDTSYPCGAVPQCASATSSADSKGNTSNGQTSCPGGLGRRGNMYYYSGGAGYSVTGSSSAMDSRSLPIGSQLTSTVSNGFTVNYGVGALLCIVKQPGVTTAAGVTVADPTECTADATQSAGTFIFTVTAVGSIAGESASSTLSTSFGLSPGAAGAANAPTITASGTIDLTGNGTFVTAPNAGGTGVPVTVWSPQCVTEQGAGTVNTCFMGNWMRATSGTFSFATNHDGSTSTVPICTGSGNKACSCSSNSSDPNASISAASGNLGMGADILTNQSVGGCNEKLSGKIVGVDSACSTDPSKCQTNYNVNAKEFPCDLFYFIFHVHAWDDLQVQSPGTANSACTSLDGTVKNTDCFCEYHKSETVVLADGGSGHVIGYDEAYLYKNALFILPLNATQKNWIDPAKRVTSCSQLVSSVASTGGLIWDQTGTCLNSVSQIGYPDRPVILVEDGSATLQQATVFGLVFIRDTTAAGSSTSYGGAADFRSNSTGTIYGSVVIQGTGEKLNGSSSIVYSTAVMGALKTLPSLKTPAALPASWTDRYAY
ncbi:hypothetical protein [Rudaea cellulosilytica]|uniref:hypothetical protein n=1 Tax=Rudaea cellulosilytica TaxID=540746 RepID=UPI0003A694AF|nr:hypothetical protein [Rudaea cellulosilytica]